MDRPFLIAHRAGNDLASLRSAEALGIRVAEADVRLFHGRLEVRHLKSVGPLPLLWDSWQLASPWAPRLQLHELLRAAGPGIELMLDLKGLDPRLAPAVAACLDEHGDGRRVTVCSRNWRLLAPFARRDDVRVLHSVGSARQLRALRRRLATTGPLAGVSIHMGLLSERVVADLKRRAGIVASWPVETEHDAERLGGWGVDGLITKRFDRLLAAGAAA